MMYHFFACLRTFHPLTMHLKVKDLNKSFASCNLYSCPFGKGAAVWRRHHGLKYLTGSMINMQCQCNKPQQYGAMKNHLQKESSNFMLHKGINMYLSACTKNLQHYQQFYAERDSCRVTIHSYKSKGNRLPSKFSDSEEETSHNSDEDYNDLRVPLSDKLPNTINVSIPIQPDSRTSSKVVGDVTEGGVTPIAKEMNDNVVLNKMGTISKNCSKGNADDILVEKNTV